MTFLESGIHFYLYWFAISFQHILELIPHNRIQGAVNLLYRTTKSISHFT